MGLVLFVSLVLRGLAFVWISLEWFRGQRWPAAILGVLVLALMLQQIALIFGWWTDSAVSLVLTTALPYQLVDVCISLSLLLLVWLVSQRTEWREQAVAVHRSPTSRLAWTALGMSALAMAGMALIAWQAYASSRRAILQTVADDSLSVCRSIVGHAERALAGQPADAGLPDRAVDELASLWDDMRPAYAGTYLCVIDSSGRLVLAYRPAGYAGTPTSPG